MADWSQMKLGRKATKVDSRTLRLEDYISGNLPRAPHSLTWTKHITEFGMMGNDSLGDCTIAACGHAGQVWSMNSSSEITVPDQTIIDAYSAWCGYKPGDLSTDNGGIPLDVLTDFRQQGMGPLQLNAFLSVDESYHSNVQDAMMLFGGVYIGLDMPLTAMYQDEWDVELSAEPSDQEPGSWGGHAVWVPNYDGNARTVHGFTAISWGRLIRMTRAFWDEYVTECYGLVSPQWIGPDGKAPSGFDQQQLLADLALIK